MYLLLHRAIKNAGDFLIFERARALIEDELPDARLVYGRSWEPLSAQLTPTDLRSLRAIVVCGGPGYQRSMYPDVYPLAPIDTIPVPVILLSLGSYLFPGTEAQVAAFRFDRNTEQLLRRVTALSTLGARDRLTADLLRSAGFSRVVMAGDPAWYDLDRIDSPSLSPRNIERIAFTPPANPMFFHQGVELLRALASRFSGRGITVVFHRGGQLPFIREAARLGAATADISGGATGFSVYDELGAHVGYRVHAHLYCLSRGLVSYLVAEDSRGRGVHATLGPLGSDPLPDRSPGWLLEAGWRNLPRLASARRFALNRAGVSISRLMRLPRVGEEIVTQMTADHAAGYERHAAARRVIQATMPVMRKMIREIP